jgi:hypothetical protein
MSRHPPIGANLNAAQLPDESIARTVNLRNVAMRAD